VAGSPDPPGPLNTEFPISGVTDYRHSPVFLYFTKFWQK